MKYTTSQLSSSLPYKQSFNRDSFELFRIHFPNQYSSANNYRVIWRDKIGGEKSLFNKLGTNWSAYTELVNLTLEHLNKDIDPRSESGYNEIINYLKENKEFFKSILPKIGVFIKASSDIGDKYELKSDDVIKKVFGNDVIIKNSAGLGKFTDTHLGIDKSIIQDGKEFNIQIKGVSNIVLDNGIYTINYVNAKLYPGINIFIFHFKGKYYLFNNIGVTVSNDSYIIPEDSLIKIV
jgi:hypothetical protein